MSSRPGSLVTDLLSPEAISDPHAVYRALREHGTVVWLPEHHAWFVTTYRGVHDGFRDQRLSSDRLTPLHERLDDQARRVLGPTFELLRGWMVFHDPPGHERLKAPVRRAFTPRAVEDLRPHIDLVVDGCVSEMTDRMRSGETVDLVESLAFPLPAIVIAELLGVPPADRDDFKTWSAQLAAIVFGSSNRAEQAASAAAGTAQFVAYFSDLIDHYERHPADNLISELIRARDLADPPLTSSELVGACTLLLFGGHETTTNLIGNATLALLDHPDELRWLHEHLDQIANAVEELHRFDGSSKVMVRVVGEPHDHDHARFEVGQTVFLGIASANRDPAVFADPDRLRLDRAEAGRHLGFGSGLHFCLGAPLARLETQVALAKVVARCPDLSLALERHQVRHGATILGRGVAELPVCLG